MNRTGLIWLAVLLALVASAYVVPYAFLSGVESFAGAFLFWTLFGLAALAMIVGAALRWRA